MKGNPYIACSGGSGNFSAEGLLSLLSAIPSLVGALETGFLRGCTHGKRQSHATTMEQLRAFANALRSVGATMDCTQRVKRSPAIGDDD